MANVSSFSGAMPVIPGGTVELGYSQITSGVTVNNGTAGTGVEVIAPFAVVCDGGPILVEFFSPEVRPWTAANYEINISLFEDGVEKIRSWGRNYNSTSSFDNKPMQLQARLTPSAGSHTYSVKSYVTNTSPSTNTGFIGAGTGTTGSAPAFLRVSKIVNQNDGLKPFWTPPVVTQLPSQATEGDQVLLYSSSPYAGYQTHQYVTGSWRTLDDSRGVGAWQDYTPQVDQGASTNIGKTVGYAKFIQVGKTVTARVRMDMTASGSAGSVVSVTAPVPCISAVATNYVQVGSGAIYDSSATTRYLANIQFQNDTSKMTFIGDWSANSSWGGTPNIALGSGDQIAFQITYEAA